MPELPEVEVLRRYLDPLVSGKRLCELRVFKSRVVRPESSGKLIATVKGCRVKGVERRGKFLWLNLVKSRSRSPFPLVIHLGMTGRLFVQPSAAELPRHVAAVFRLGRESLIFKDTRLFGRITLETDSIEQLGPDPITDEFLVSDLQSAIGKSAQPVKVRLMNQRVLAGLGNIYACEVLHRAGISPFMKSSDLRLAKFKKLHEAIVSTLARQVEFGMSLDLDFIGETRSDGLFYFGSRHGQARKSKERFRVYGRAGEPCGICSSIIKRAELGKRGTFFCVKCQKQ